MRPKGVRSREMFCACAGLGLIGAIADGVGEVRRAVREQVRNGANHIKIMGGGGISSPTDPIDGTQFSVEELRAACEEAEAANLYAMAHAYSPRAVTRAVQAGVRSIEHGNLIDEATAKVMKAHGAYLVPTLSTYVALAEEGQRLGWSPAMLDKLKVVHERGIEAVRIARAEGVPVVFGTDLLGYMHDRQSGEFDLRLASMTPVEALQSATFVAAQLMQQEGQIGQLVKGAWADLLVVEGDPTASLTMLAEPVDGVRMVMKGGRVVRSSGRLCLEIRRFRRTFLSALGQIKGPDCPGVTVQPSFLWSFPSPLLARHRRVASPPIGQAVSRKVFNPSERRVPARKVSAI
jgi:imidazolonepropionase-like amidohydrolase